MSDAAKLIFFSHSRIMFHVFFLFFSATIRHIAQSGIYFRRIIPAWLLPAFHNQSSCLPQSILQSPTINPTASNNQSYSLPQSILLPPGIFSLLLGLCLDRCSRFLPRQYIFFNPAHIIVHFSVFVNSPSPHPKAAKRTAKKAYRHLKQWQLF